MPPIRGQFLAYKPSTGLAPKYYLKEIRYNQVPLINGTFTPVDAAQLEIVVDDKVASLSGVVMGGDKPAGHAMVMLTGQGGLATALVRASLSTGKDDSR